MQFQVGAKHSTQGVILLWFDAKCHIKKEALFVGYSQLENEKHQVKFVHKAIREAASYNPCCTSRVLFFNFYKDKG